MQKIPTLFVRDAENMRTVLFEVNPSCEWVMNGEGVATRKYDGICVLYDLQWWARREVKLGKTPPAGFNAVETDPNTGKTVGWEPIESSPFFRFFQEAFDLNRTWFIGTYELCGPKINGNPEKFDEHKLIRHSEAEILGSFSAPRTFEEWKDTFLKLGDSGWEGVVWHHPDGRMAKLKVRDF